MLTPILGRSRSGKSTELYRILNEQGGAGKKCILIVPEQFSFEAEKLTLLKTAPAAAANIEVMSFSRMADKLIEQYEPVHAPYITPRGKLLLMNLVLDDIWDRLSVYGRVRNKNRLAAELVTADTELKRACISAEKLAELTPDAANESLARKLGDLGLIFGVYNSVLNGKFSDRSNALQHLCDILERHRDFTDCVIAVDEFGGFTEDELAVLERLMEYTARVYITFCTDSADAPSGASFAFSRKSYDDVLALARKNHTRIAAPIRLTQTYYACETLAHSEQYLFDAAPEYFDGDADGICICKCENKAEECEFAALTAKKLIYEQGYRCRDIAVIERTKDSYAADIISAFARYGIDVFKDTRRSIACAPAAAYLLAFAENALRGITTDAVMRMLRSGMTDLSAEEIDLLDNYVLMFGIDGAEWQREWQYNPMGFGAQIDDNAAALLARINDARARIIGGITAFADACKQKTCGEIVKALYAVMLSADVADKTKQLATQLARDGKNDEAETVVSAYNELMECLSDLYDVIGERYVSGKRFFELLAETVQSTTAGVVPQGLDEVAVGSADRIRISEKKAVILVGVNEGVFPAVTEPTGIFSDSERRLMSTLGADISGDKDYLAQRERYMCYRAFSGASARMYLTYSKKSVSGERLMPSEIIGSLRRMLPETAFGEFSDVPAADRAAGREIAFRYLASHYLSTDSTVTALLAYFRANGDGGKLDALDRLARKTAPRFADASNAARLYGDVIMISPSRADSYFTCAFQYFCKFGLHALPRKTAELSASQNGLAVHYVLQRVFETYGSRGITRLTDAEKMAAVQTYTDEYITLYMQGLAEKSRRMRFIVNSYTEVIYTVLCRMADEFAHSAFETCDTELDIGMRRDRDGLAPYFVCDGAGGTVGVRGTVDRVDMLKTDAGAYLRVVDYKTNAKEFRFGEVAAGLNMQMLIYLMALWQNGGQRYGTHILPAGALYIPAKIGTIALSRTEDTAAQNLKNGKMNGLLLDDPVSLQAMGADRKDSYIPAQLQADGAAKGAVISLAQFENLHKLIDQKLAEMGAGLRGGNITPKPICMDKKTTACAYCDYRGVCLHEADDEKNEVTVLSDAQMRAMLTGEEGAANG
ncbi:MAG: PD-(D/E)XK nuclease family protein [Clostridia bacterium]|nr:PD-(D/E)XK nuclease family protein [Clostridia bacterium]